MATFRAALAGLPVAAVLVAAAGFGQIPLAAAAPDQSPSAPSEPCYNGIYPLNPYANNCALPQRPKRVLGSAPDQTALLNCDFGGRVWRAQCLSLFVNGGYGLYPGATLVPGYSP
jgi:hypothetical protein